MNELKIFKNPAFGEIRTVAIDDEPWLVGKDVATALGYKDTVNALKSHVDDEDKLGWQITTSGQGRDMTVINESGLYSLILSSKLPTAKEFKHWITSEVLPSIRKTGGYIDGQETMTDAELLAKAILVAQKQIEERDREIERMRPMELFAAAVSASDSSILIGDLAKLLRQNGIQIGQKRLFEWMRENGYLIRKPGASWNMPTQMSMERGLFEVKETVVSHSDGHISVNRTPKCTGKGQVFFVNKFLADRERKETQTERGGELIANGTEI